jgi:hypothetical protein
MSISPKFLTNSQLIKFASENPNNQIFSEIVRRYKRFLNNLNNPDNEFLLFKDLPKDLIEKVQNHAISPRTEIITVFDNRIELMKSSKDYLAVRDNTTMKLINMYTGKSVEEFESCVYDFSPDGNYLALIKDKTLIILDLITFQTISFNVPFSLNVKELTYINNEVIQILTKDNVITAVMSYDKDNCHFKFLPAKTYCEDFKLTDHNGYNSKGNKLCLQIRSIDYFLIDKVINNCEDDFHKLNEILTTQTFSKLPNVVQNLLRRRLEKIMDIVKSTYFP